MDEQTDRLAALGGSLMRKIDERVKDRYPWETRWLEDLRQNNSKYDSETEGRLRQDNTKSRVFVNLTRPKVNAAESRIVEMLSEERIFATLPTPVPELRNAMEGGAQAQHQDGSFAVDDQGNPRMAASEAAKVMKEAKRKAKRMEEEIADQLVQAQFTIAYREMIHEGVLLGTGVIKGPVVVGKMKESWQTLEGDGDSIQVLKREVDHRASVFWVSLWDFYPDLSVPRIEDSESVFERHRMTRKDLLKMANDPGVILENIKQVLKTDPREGRTTSSWTNDIREISGNSGFSSLDSRYEGWEYNGPIDKEDLIACGCEVDEDDPLEMYTGTIIFINNIVIKTIINPMDTNDGIYSVWNWERDDTSIFGFGIPFQTRHAQRVVNSGWRLVLENAALSSKPQILMHRNKVQPANGRWELTAGKHWWATSESVRLTDVFTTFDIPNRQQDLMQIIATASRFFEDETSLPLIAQGQQAPGTTKTAAGMSLLMNSANTVLRRAIKYFDDGVVIPIVRRFYDWNMQYGKNEDIKGDYEVQARASSVLLVREVQAKNLQQVLGLAASVPQIGQITKWAPAYRKAIQAQQLSPDDIVMTDDEIETEKQNAPQPQPDPAIEKLKLDAQIAGLEFEDKKAKREHEKEMRELDREIKLLDIQITEDVNKARIDASLTASRMREQNKRDLYANEQALKLKTGEGI